MATYFDTEEVKKLYGTIGVVVVDVPWGLILNSAKSGVVFMDQVHDDHITAICVGISKVLRPKGTLLSLDVLSVYSLTGLLIYFEVVET